MREAFAGSTSHSLLFFLVDSTTGLGKTSVAYTAVTASYARSRAARTAISVSALLAITDAFSSGGWFEVDGTNQPGLYRLDAPDAAFASGAEEVVVSVKATGCKTEHRGFRLVAVNALDAVRFGLTSLPNADAAASGGLPIFGTGTGSINPSGGKIPATLASTDVTGNVAVDLQTIKTQTVTCAGAVTVPAATLASEADITALNNISASDVVAATVEGSITLGQALAVILAAEAGKISGAGGSTITIRDANDTANRIVAAVDGTGNRTSITLTLP